MIRSGHLDGHHRGDDRVAGENVVDGDHRRKPGVGGKRRRETRSGLVDGVVVTVGQQVAELAHVRGAVVVAPDDDRPGSGGSGEVVQLGLGAGVSVSTRRHWKPTFPEH
jgi:hypothetical protein